MATNLVPVDPDRHMLEDMTTRIAPRTASNVLLWGILLFFVVAVAWAALTRLDRTVHAPGRIVPSSRLQLVSNLEAGIVRQILVKAGDDVKKGQALVLLDKTASGAELSAGESTAASLSAKVARLEAEVNGREPRYPAVGDNPQLAEQVAIERSLHASRLNDLASGTSAATARITQAQRAVVEAEATYQSRLAQQRSLEQQLRMLRPLVDRGIEPRISLVQLENGLSVAQSDAAASAAAAARAHAAVAEATAGLNQIRQQWRTQAATELAGAQAEFAARRNALPALQDRVRRTTLVAPMDGRINRVTVSTVGGTIAGGQPIVELVPSEDTLLVEATVMPKDIAHVRIGQSARINVSAYDSAIYGSMDGAVETISPDAVLDEKTGESHYQVRVRARPDTLKNALGQTLQLGSGMTVDVNLLGEKRSVLSYLFTPITRLSERALRE
ncbi:HlyD family type I secretion periplasmic adaptor subunit [Sphingomonas sp.]|uniref:HlyD family type I secretion periplasmic adaptor subunit n=1 Tax=Sphingomonas sp. TaxID=28214 RepID=UPI002C915A5A|nr:HlyD family type I secretion periplasmic adaptor subunit [Sphingomonas sp.]HWK36465.1 HlyD family type I secretion periplasmic adaptor subunit [Sphingomonas sp.]